jgi:putative DNA primase/helicase
MGIDLSGLDFGADSWPTGRARRAKPVTPASPIVDCGGVMLPAAVAALAEAPRWVGWRYDEVKGRTTKVPYGRHGRRARSNDPTTWLMLADVPVGAFDGPGIMLGDGLQGVDLDACLGADGTLEAWALEVLDRLDSYAEISPSGGGVKVLVRGPAGHGAVVKWGGDTQMPDGSTKKRELAYFTSGRYFTITGEVFRDRPIREIDEDDVQWLRKRIEKIRAEGTGTRINGKAHEPATPPGDDASAPGIGNLPAWLADLIRDGVAEGGRSEQFYKVVMSLSRMGCGASGIERILAAYPAGIAAKYTGRLREEITRITGNGVGIATGNGVEPLTPEFSDDHLALAFVRQYGPNYRWTPGMDWMRDTGTHWTRDEHLTRFDCSRTICREASNLAPDKGGERRRLASAKTVAAALSMAQSDPRIVVPAEAWDRDPMLLNTPGGVVDLRTGRLRARNGDDFVTQITSVVPDAAMKAPNWLRFIGEVFAHDTAMIEFVQRMGGYCLTGDRREQKLFFAHGTGSNGKNTLLDLWLWIMGTYSVKLPTITLMQSPFDRHPTELAQLRGKRLAMSGELEEGQYWAEARIKELTGDEFLTARFMRQDFFEFRMTQKHLIAGNYKPRLKGGDAAMARRMVLIPFLEKFEDHRKDATLPAKLRPEAPAVLAWLIDGAVKWHTDGLAIPHKVRDASAEYMAEHDDLALWIDECCRLEIGLMESGADLYGSFNIWKRDRGEHAPSQTAWGQRMAQRPGIHKHRSNGIHYVGIGLTNEARINLAKRTSKT